MLNKAATLAISVAIEPGSYKKARPEPRLGCEAEQDQLRGVVSILNHFMESF